jgi:hypothetical protein
MSTIQTALSNHDATIAYWSHSIGEGADIGYANGWPALNEAWMRREFDSCHQTHKNYSLSGRSVGEAISTTFLGAAFETSGVDYFRPAGESLTPPNPSHWPGGSTIGQAWREKVKASGADLLFIGHPANATSDTVAFKYTTEALLDWIATWPKVPTIVLVTDMVPVAGYGPVPANVAGANQAYREIGAARGIYVADAAALCAAKLTAGYTTAQMYANGINHPTAFASRACYFAALDGFLASLKNPSTGSGNTAFGYSSDAVTTFAAGDYAGPLIGGTGGGAIMVPGSNTFARDVLNAGSVTIQAMKNGSTQFMSHTLTFPYTGDWSVEANVSVSWSGSTYRHILTSRAWKK